jgi:serine/threonine-protein kinase HipA
MPAPKLRELDVYLAGRLVGHLTRPGSGRLAFQYSEEIASENPREVVLSASLPVERERFSNARTRPFFEGLLPEGAIKEQIARERGVSVSNAFGLLAEIGAECAGAVVIVRSGAEPAPATTASVRWLSPEELEAALAALPSHPLGVGDDVRLSLGGVQQKLVVTRAPSGKFGQPIGGAPSTHIVKPSLPGFEDIAANEAFCLRVAACCRLESARATVEVIGDAPCLIVERFDRTLTDDLRIERVHQEDFCQALGLLPGSKYELEGGPSIAQIVAALRAVGGRPGADVNAFIRAVGFNFLIGNSDGHGKNFAILYDPDLGPRLAPLYDLVCTAVYDVTTKMAMRIGGEEDPGAVDEETWRRLAHECGLNATLLLRNLRALAEHVLSCADAVSRAAIAEGWHRPIIDRIVEEIGRRTARVGARPSPPPG